MTAAAVVWTLLGLAGLAFGATVVTQRARYVAIMGVCVMGAMLASLWVH